MCAVPAPATMADFQSVALEEAATAFTHQLSGLLILHASAKVHTSGRHQLATSFLGDQLDERGAGLIDDGVFGMFRWLWAVTPSCR